MDAEPFLLRRPDHIIGVVDYSGRPISRSSSGGWRSAGFIIGVEIAERFAFFGIAMNLISYLTGPLHQPTASAAAATNAWQGAGSILPLVGAFLGDSYLGRYRTILISSVLYVLGLCMLTLSTALPSLRPPECKGPITASASACSPSTFQLASFYFSIYLVAFAQGGHKPCVAAFAADQFDQNDPQECKSRSSFFNWWYLGVSFGILAAVVVLSYVQDNVSWSLGFGLLCVSLIFALITFLLGTKIYRFYPMQDENSLVQITKTIFALARNRGSTDFTSSKDDMGKQWTKDEDVQKAKGLLQLLPIWASCMMLGVLNAQNSTFFTKQGSTLDRRIGPTFQVPPAALQSFIDGSVIILIPLYDCVFVPVARKYTKLPSGITMLQRIGIGLTLSAVSMAVAALVEIKRLKAAEEFGLVDHPDAMIPMSLWWLVPQYLLTGVSNVFANVGLQEFFYDQVPDALRSLGFALYLSVFGVGFFVSSALIPLIDRLTMKGGQSWFSDNLNQGHLDYFYWLLAGLSALMLLLYFYLAQAYRYKNK